MGFIVRRCVRARGAARTGSCACRSRSRERLRRLGYFASCSPQTRRRATLTCHGSGGRRVHHLVERRLRLGLEAFRLFGSLPSTFAFLSWNATALFVPSRGAPITRSAVRRSFTRPTPPWPGRCPRKFPRRQPPPAPPECGRPSAPGSRLSGRRTRAGAGDFAGPGARITRRRDHLSRIKSAPRLTVGNRDQRRGSETRSSSTPARGRMIAELVSAPPARPPHAPAAATS